MITHLHLQDWKSFADSRIYIDPLTILIGTNSSGKSNALDALEFLSRTAKGTTLTSSLQGDGALPALRGGLEWASRDSEGHFTLGVTVTSDETVEYIYEVCCHIRQNKCEILSEALVRKKYRLSKDRERGKEIGQIRLFWTEPATPDDPSIFARLYNEKAGTKRQFGRSNTVLFQLSSQSVRSDIHNGVEQVIKDLRQIFILDPIPSHMRGFSQLSDMIEPDGSNIAGVIAAYKMENDPNIEKKISHYVRKIPDKGVSDVFVEQVGKFQSDAMLYCEESWPTEPPLSVVDARGMSDGTLRFLAILTALFTRPERSLLIIEEVDNGLHPSRAGLLLQVLREVGTERSIDVIVTTHNPALLDALGTKFVPFISIAHRDKQTGYSKFTLLEDLNNLPRLLGEGSLGRLATRGRFEASLQEKEEAGS